MYIFRVIASLLIFAAPLALHASEASAAAADSAATDSTASRKTGFIHKVVNYFTKDDDNLTQKGFHVSFIGGPHYNSDTKLGIGLVGSGFYRVSESDTLSQPSNVTIYTDVATSKFALIGIRGNTLMANDAHRLNYNLSFYYLPTYICGIGYHDCDNDDNEEKMTYRHMGFKLDYLWRLAKGLYAGPSASWQWAKADSIERMELMGNQRLTVRNYGIGLTLDYDTRDLITNAYRGTYVHLGVMFQPKFMGNHYAFTTAELRACHYRQVWKGGVLAGEFYTKFNFGNPSWATMSELGGSNSMRGYYGGRYRDKHIITMQVELRQHVWRRNGIALWVGGGNVFHDSHSFKHLLPNYGIGYRWEFRKRVNVRLDYGFGKSGQHEFIFNINEAF